MFNQRNNITIADIAKLAGVSKTTVSRFINGNLESMGSATAEKIQEIIDRFNYHPNSLARGLKSKKSYLIGVVMSDITSPFSSSVMYGIERKLTSLNYTPLFLNTSNSIKKEIERLYTLASKNVDGIIVNTSTPNNPNLIEIANNKMPVVLCDRPVKNYNFDIVTVDNNLIIEMAMSHLVSEGYNRIALFTQPWDENLTRYARYQYFLQQSRKYVGPSEFEDVYIVHPNVPAPVKEFIDSLRPGDIPAIICANSVTLFSVYCALKPLNISMPHGIGLCGPDDWCWGKSMNWMDNLDVGITTVSIDAIGIGEVCADLILHKIDHPDSEPQRIELKPEISIRPSSMRRSLKLT